MKINLSQISEVWKTFEFEEKAAAFPVFRQIAEDDSCRFTSCVKTELSLIKVRDLIEAKGIVKTEVMINCSRCLEVFSHPLAVEFELTYTDKIETNDVSESEEIELSSEDLDMVHYAGDTIDFRDEIQEQVVMSLPRFAMCSTSCKGLCKKCGANLNKGDCGCEEDQGHPAFAVLKNLKK